LVDFQELLNLGLISVSDYESIYDKSRTHNRIVLAGVHDVTAILKNEHTHSRLNPTKDFTRGSIASGTYQIGTGTGADYATVTTFEADIAAQLTGDLTGEHQAEETAISAVVTFDTDTNSHILKLTAESGAEHDGKWNTSTARINYGTYDYISLNEGTDGHLDDVIIEKLQIDNAGTSNYGIYILDGGNSGHLIIQKNIVKGDADSSCGIYCYYEATNVRIINNIVYDHSKATANGIMTFPEYAANVVLIANNTLIGNYNNLNQGEDSSARLANHTIKNNLCQADAGGSDYVDAGGGFGTTGYNVSEDATSPDASYQSKYLDTNSVFMNYAGDDFRLNPAGDATGLAILDDGEDLSGTFTDDVIGTTRVTWYIGAYELVTSSSSVSATKSSTSSQSSISSQSSVFSSPSSVSSQSVTKSSGSSQSSVSSLSSVSNSQSSVLSLSSSSVSKTKSSASESVTKSSSSDSVSLTKSSSSESVTKSSNSESISITKSSSSESVTKSSSSVSVTKSSVSSQSSVCSVSQSSSESGSHSSLSESSTSATKSSISSQSTSQTKSSVSSSSVSGSKSSVSSSFSFYDIGTTIFNLSWGANSLNYSKFEVDRVELRTEKKLDLQRLQNREPIIYELGTDWKLITVTLNPAATPMTVSKLEAIRQVTDIMTLTMYYSDGVTQAEQYNVRVNPNAASYFYGGHVDAMKELELVFYEAVVS
jgi:hypothetical protein